jgi:hypothetical protein
MLKLRLVRVHRSKRCEAPIPLPLRLQGRFPIRLRSGEGAPDRSHRSRVKTAWVGSHGGDKRRHGMKTLSAQKLKGVDIFVANRA